MLGPRRDEARAARPAAGALGDAGADPLHRLVCLFTLALATPLTFWLARLPQLWADLQLQLSELRGPLEALRSMRDQLRDAHRRRRPHRLGRRGHGRRKRRALAPAVLGQILIFFACLYFFVATRHQTRTAILKLCLNRRLRWRVAHIFRDVERMVSRYLLSITVINMLEGFAVGVGLFADRRSSPRRSGARLPR